LHPQYVYESGGQKNVWLQINRDVNLREGGELSRRKDKINVRKFQDGGGPYSISHEAGWNLVSLPVEVEDSSVSAVYPDAIAETLYSYNGDTYVGVDTLVFGEGYWLHFLDAGTTTITGTPIMGPTISLNEGWNLLGGISETTTVSDIFDPDGIIIAGTIYEFTGGSYVNASALIPGHGYWVNASTAGDITMIFGRTWIQHQIAA